jgi:hypothetical protein
MIDKPCGCNDCPWPTCACGEDHGSCPGGLCRDCFHDSLFKRIANHEAANPGALEKRVEELAKVFGSKKKATP